MDYIYDAPYADKFECNGDLNWHDYYYINPNCVEEKHYLYQLNRTGIEQNFPSLFSVERSDQTPYCEIFCITSGKGTLTYRGKTYTLSKDQIVFLNSHEPHRYSSDPKEPLGKIWIEFLGSDSPRIMESLLSRYSPIATGLPFATACREISLIQQKLMSSNDYNPSVDIYRLLSILLSLPEDSESSGETTWSIPWKMIESYIHAHLNEQISNDTLADLCSISLPYFIKCFKKKYHLTPQQYIHKKRIERSRYLLTRTSYSISEITEQLGFCNESHFIRIFKEFENTTPHRYRKIYNIDFFE